MKKLMKHIACYHPVAMGHLLFTWTKTALSSLIQKEKHEQCEIIAIHNDCDFIQCGVRNLSILYYYV